MRKLDIGQWTVLISNTAVVAGLIFLIMELDQSNRISRYASENARRSQFIEINTSMIEHADLYAKLQGNAQDLSATEKVKALMMARQLMNTWSDAQSAHDYGLLSDATLALTLVDISVSTREAPGLLPFIAYLHYRGDSNVEALTQSEVFRQIERVLHDAGIDAASERIYSPERVE